MRPHRVAFQEGSFFVSRVSFFIHIHIRFGVLLSSSSREGGRVERNRDIVVRWSSGGVSLSAEYSGGDVIERRGVVAIFVFVTKHSCSSCENVFFLRTTGVDFSKIRRVGSYDDSGFLLGTTSMSLGIAYEPRARNIICHPCAVDLMINETIYYTTRG